MEDNKINSCLVYSTSQGRVRPERVKPAVPETDGVVRLRYETKDRKGKGMTLITDLSLSESGLLDLAKKLKQRFGTGGSVKDHIIELQGDHREQVGEELRKLGYTVKGK